MRSLKPDRRNMKKHLLCRGMLSGRPTPEECCLSVHWEKITLLLNWLLCILAWCGSYAAVAKSFGTPQLRISQCRLQARQQFSSFVSLTMNSKVISHCVVPHYCIWSDDIDGRHWFELICGQWDETLMAEVLLCKFQAVCLT